MVETARIGAVGEPILTLMSELIIPQWIARMNAEAQNRQALPDEMGRLVPPPELPQRQPEWRQGYDMGPQVYGDRESTASLAHRAIGEVGNYFGKQIADPIKKTMGPLYGEMGGTSDDVLNATMMGVAGGWPGRGKGPNAIGEINAWHGSPYKFDKFKMDKIGTGEGAQAFGHGLYFSSEKDIALDYAKKLGKNRNGIFIQNEALPITERLHKSGEFSTIRNILYEERATPEELAKAIGKDPGQFFKNASSSDVGELIDNLKKGNISKTSNQLYQVTLHKGKQPGEYSYLKWDEPVPKSAWEKIRDQFKKEEMREDWAKFAQDKVDGKIPNQTGESLYNSLATTFSDPKKASDLLLHAGVDGIEYPAGSLSGAKSNARNYVVFDENAISIESPRLVPPPELPRRGK
jgi:hypothetical protein